MNTKEQSVGKKLKDGDICVHCGHFDPEKGFHHWIANGVFVRPDGSVGNFQWLLCCKNCFHETNGQPERIQVRGDTVWRGKEPRVTNTVNPYEPQSHSI